ncbi:MAG: hypothetical protein JXA03_08480 [Bacteroidales bacterium]|nr:hypothetical protein [Bacteroidales bacterium]
MQDNYTILLEKLDRFIRKYYANQLIRGSIYFVSLWVVFFLTVNFVEYFGRLEVVPRTIMFYLFIGATLFIFWWYVLVSLLKLYRLGKFLTHEEASRIIGRHFPDVSDRLLNTLQLKKMEEIEGVNMELIKAGIDQKAEELRPVAFTMAIDLKKNLRYTRYLLPPVLILIVLLLASPTFITEPAGRLIRHGEHFEKPLPFRVIITNEKLEGIQYEDYRLEIVCEGTELPGEVFLEIRSGKIKIRKTNPSKFYHDFLNLQEDIEFTIDAGKVVSGPFSLKVLPKPVILDFRVNLDYPAYTGKSPETLDNNGDMIVPEGTTVSWKFFTSNTKSLSLRFDTALIVVEQKDAANAFTHSRRMLKSTYYSVLSRNEFLTGSDSLLYQISVIPDLYPTIVLEEFRDSLLQSNLFFRGVIRDDYGFSRLTFNYKVKSENGIEAASESESLPLRSGVNPQQYYHFRDIAAMNLRPGDIMEYYFEVWDNDAVNGSKSSRTQTMAFRAPTLDEIEEMTESANKSIKEEMEESIHEARDLQKQAEELQRKLVDKNELSWEDKQQVQSLLDRQQELKAKMENIQKENEIKSLKESQFKEINPEILEKQKQLEELLNELLKDEELQKLFDELQKLMEEVDKNKVNEMLEKMKMTGEEMEDILDRNLELFKQFEFEKKLDETISKLEDLAKKQDSLAGESGKKDAKSDDLKNEQDKLNNEFNKLQEDLKELDNMNRGLESPNEFNPMEEQQENISQEMQESSEMLQKGSKSKASQSQKSAAEKMQDMAESLSQQQEEMLEEGMMEDIDALRDLLENLIQLSFDQESLIEQTKSVNINDPQFNEVMKEQKTIRDDIKMIEDSLIALSKRNIMIEPFVNKEVGEINRNMETTIDLLHQRRMANAAARQQYIMTSINNLALLLSESLEQMQMSMQSQQQGGKKACKSKCNKPGSGQSNMKSIRQLQQQLGQQIEELKKGMKPGGKMEGGSQGNEKQNMSEKLARLAAEQQAIRGRLQEVAGQLEKEGQLHESGELKRIMEEMEKTETDLVNKMISQETLLRQQNIMTRLLKSEKAEMEREQEEKRESKEAKNEFEGNPEQFFEYKRLLNNEVELLKTVPPKLNPFYREKVNQYFYFFEK